ncbi:hypothetical protein [Streptomyces griseoluteus]|uniref:hypothetical protein n=1 Tax=Streptomyces griseoluteus TaxID=29306 RepID=UPI0036794067
MASSGSRIAQDVGVHGQDAGDAAARLQSCLVSDGDRVTDAGLQSVDEVADLGVENPGLDDRQRGAGLGRQAGAGRDVSRPPKPLS